jgi:hypothetical protein
MSVDLSELKAGDSVVFRSGEKALVNYIRASDYEGFKIYFFMIGNGLPISFSDDYYKSGIIQFSDESDNDIVDIIHNVKKWTDEDMKIAFCRWHSVTPSDDKFYHWLNVYRMYKLENKK